MRVQGSKIPETIHIEYYPQKDGYVEIRLRENVQEVIKIHEPTNQEYTMYEYDEYVFQIPNREGLREDIESNLSDWLITGKTLEVNINASIVADYRNALNAIYQGVVE